MKQPSAFFRKVTALFLVLCFAAQESGGAQSVSARVVMDPRGESRTAFLPEAGLPAHLGTVEEVWTPPSGNDSGPHVVLIQDAHGQEEAQKSAAQILEHLDQSGRLDQVLIEGGFGKLDPSRLLFFKEELFNRKAAEFLFRESEIGGAELFLLFREARPSPMDSRGIEDPELYLRNLAAYQELYKNRSSAEKLLYKALLELQTEASRAFNKELYRVFMQWADYERGAVTLEEELDRLGGHAAEFLGFNWNEARLQLEWPMMVRYREIKRRSALLDSEAAAEDEKKLLDWAEKNLDSRTKEELSLILNSGAGFEGRREFWERFHAGFSSKGFSFEHYPALFAREGMKILENELEGIRLVKEADLLRARVLEKLTRSSREKEGLRAFRDYLLLKNLFRAALTREEFESLNEKIENRKKIPSRFRPYAVKAVEYYKLALARDTAMARNILASLKEGNKKNPSVAVIAGGFHREGLTQAFRSAGISYTVVSPHFAEIQDGVKYEEVMTGRESLFDLSHFQIRAAQWMNDWQGLLPQPLADRRAALESALLKRGLELGAEARSELRAEKPWKDWDALYKDIDRISGLKKAPGRSPKTSEAALFLKFIRNEEEFQKMLAQKSPKIRRENRSFFYSVLADWLEGNLSRVLALLEKNKDAGTLTRLLAFSRTHTAAGYADQIEASLRSVEQTSRSELRAAKPWEELSDLYDDIDRLSGLKKAPGRKKSDPTLSVFLKFVRYEDQALALMSDPQSRGIFLSVLTDWLDGNLTKLMEHLESAKDAATLNQLLGFSRRYMESPYADRQIELAVQRVETARLEQRRAERAQKTVSRKSRKAAKAPPLKYSRRPRHESVRSYTGPDERAALRAQLRARELPAEAPVLSRLQLPLGQEAFKKSNPWIPMAGDAVKLSFPKNLEGETLTLEEALLPGESGLRQILVYRGDAQPGNYLFSFIESETLGFSRSNDSIFVSPDYTFEHPQFPGETFWVLTTQNFDVKNPQNKFRVLTDASGKLQKVIDASGTAHPVYEVTDREDSKRLGFFVMRMDGLWAPSQDFRGRVKGFLLGREKSQRGEAHDSAYVRIPGKNVYVAPGTEGIKKADIEIESRLPVSVQVEGRTYHLILKRDEKGVLTDVAREGFYDRIGPFTGTITRFKADSYGRASLGAPLTGIQVADASKGEVWMSAALDHGVVIRTDEWKSVSPESPYVLEMMETADGQQKQSFAAMIRLAEGQPRPKKTHDFLVLRDFKGVPQSSYKLRISTSDWEKHAGQITGFFVRARGEDLGRIQIQGRDFQLPGEYQDHPVTVLRFPEERKLIFVIHSKTQSRVKDAYIYEWSGGEYSGSYQESAAFEKGLRKKYGYPLDLSNVWREKIRSEETYRRARQLFESGDLDGSEKLLHQVKIKARRQYRLAEQLLNVWIPKRRQVIESGTDRQKRRLFASFERALPEGLETVSEDESDATGSRSELRSPETNDLLLWTAVSGAVLVLGTAAAYRIRYVYRRTILESYDERSAEIRRIVNVYRSSARDLKPHQRVRARQKAVKEYREKFKDEKDGDYSLFASISAAFLGREAASVHKRDQLKRVDKILNILENRLQYELIFAERRILQAEGADAETLRKAWPAVFTLPWIERIREGFLDFRKGMTGLISAASGYLLESLAALRERFRSSAQEKTEETASVEDAVSIEPEVLTGAAEEGLGVSAEEALPEEISPAEETQDQKRIRAVARFEVVFGAKAGFLTRQAGKVESLRGLEKLLADFERELKADQERLVREMELDAEMSAAFAENVRNSEMVKAARLLLEGRLAAVRQEKIRKSEEAAAARSAAESAKLEKQRLRQEASAELRERLTRLETEIDWNRMIVFHESMAHRAEALEMARRIQNMPVLDALDRKLWQRRLADLMTSLQEKLDARLREPSALDRAVHETPDAFAAGEALLAAGNETAAEAVWTAVVWDLEKNSNERNRAVRSLITLYEQRDLSRDNVETVDNLAWLVEAEAATRLQLAALWYRFAENLARGGEREEAAEALETASGMLHGDEEGWQELNEKMEALAGALNAAIPVTKSRVRRPAVDRRGADDVLAVPDQEKILKERFERLENQLLEGTPVYDRETLASFSAVSDLMLEIANARVEEEARREVLWNELEALLDRVADVFRKARTAKAWARLEVLDKTIRARLSSYQAPQAVYADPHVIQFEAEIEAMEPDPDSSAQIRDEFYRRMNQIGAEVWRAANRRGIEYVRKHSRTLNDLMSSVGIRMEEARKLYRQGLQDQAFEIYASITQDVREAPDTEIPADVRLSTLSRSIVGMSSARRRDHSRRDRFGEALEIVEEALENVDPWSPFLAAERGWVLYHWGRSLERHRNNREEKLESALEQADVLLFREPRDRGTLDLKIASLAALGRRTEALELAKWAETEGIIRLDELTAKRDLTGRSELRVEDDGQAPETARARRGSVSLGSLRSLLTKEPGRALSAASKKTVMEALHKAYQERQVSFALERWLTQAYERRLSAKFSIYLFEDQVFSETDYVHAFFDEDNRRLYLGKTWFSKLQDAGEEGEPIRRGLLFETLFPARRVLVVGASGMVGREVFQLLQTVYPEVTGTALTSESLEFVKLDVSKAGELESLLQREKPEAVVYAAAVAGVQDAELNRDRAELLNVTVPKRIADVFDGQLVYFSSDYVFDGTQPPYGVKAETRPLNFYGETKVRGEKAALSRKGNTVIRLGWVYGAGTVQNRDPLHRALAWLDGRQGGKLVLDHEQVRHPVWAGDAAGVTLQALTRRRRGVIQLNGAEDVTRFGFTEAVWDTYQSVYPTWDLDPGSHLFSTQEERWRTQDSTAPAAETRRPLNAKMRNTYRPTPLEEVLRYLIPFYSIPDEKQFEEIYAAAAAGNFGQVSEIAQAVERKNVRWAMVGDPEALPEAASAGVRVWTDEDREELFQVLTQGVEVEPANRLRVRRVFETALMSIRPGQTGFIFVKPVSLGDTPHLEVTVYPASSLLEASHYLLSYGYMEASSFGRNFRLWVPTVTRSSFEIDETIKTDLAGGSYSKVQRVLNDDGSTVIEKTALISQDKGKLEAEARYIQTLQSSGDPEGQLFPKILSIDEKNGWTVVRMEDLGWPTFSDMIMRAFPSGEDGFGNLHKRSFPAGPSVLGVVKQVYQALTPAFYARIQSPTPDDFAERYHFQKLEQRWKEASEKSAWMKDLLAAPYLVEDRHLLLNLPTLMKLYRRINEVSPDLFKPPYLSRQHGDLHAGNILIDPFDYLRTGQVRRFRLIDPKYIPEGNDPLYDFAKLIHNYFGHYDLALDHHQTFHYNVSFPKTRNGGAVFENYFDDEASGTLMTLGRVQAFERDFFKFITDPASDEVFPFEPDSQAWRMRLLFTHASLMAGLLPFHVVNDGREYKAGIIYLRAAQLLGIFAGAFLESSSEDDGLGALRARMLEIQEVASGQDEAAFAEAVKRLDAELEMPGVQDSRRSELRVENGSFLTELGMDKAAVLEELKSEAVKWNLNTFASRHPGKMPPANKTGGYSGMIAGLDILEEYKAEVQRVLGEEMGMIHATAEHFGISNDPFKKLVRDVLKINYTDFVPPQGQLLIRIADEGENSEQVKQRLLVQLGETWDIPALRASLQEKIPVLKQTGFSNARMIWGLGLASELMKLYEERRVRFAGVETHIGESFGFQRSQAKKMMEGLTGDLRAWLKPPAAEGSGELQSTAGESASAAPLTLLRALGLTKRQVIEVLNRPEISWRLPEFVKWLETEYADRAAWIVTRGHDELLKQFEIEEEYRAKIRETARSHYRLLGPMSKTLGLDDRVLAGLANRLGVNIQDIELPPGTLNRILAPSDAIAKRQEILDKLTAADWKNFASLKEELLKGHAFIAPGSIRYAEFLWAADIVEAFSAVLEQRLVSMNGDLSQIGRSFGWEGGSGRANMERLQSRLPELLRLRKAYREKQKKVLQEAQRRAAGRKGGVSAPAVAEKPVDGGFLIHPVMTSDNPHADKAAFERALLIENFIFEVQVMEYEPQDKAPEMLRALRQHILKNERAEAAMLTEDFLEVRRPLEALWEAIQAGNETLRTEFAEYLELLAAETEIRAAAESAGGRSELRLPERFFEEPQQHLWVRSGPVRPFEGVTLEKIARAQKMLHHFWAGIGEIGENDVREGRFQVPLVESGKLDALMYKLTGIHNRYYLYYLPELPEGSFKPYLAADFLDRFFDRPEELSKIQMVVAESTGNQGKAVASLVQKLKRHPDYAPYAAQLNAVIFVPRTANPEKIKAMKALGAAVVNREFSEQELLSYVRADESGRAEIERTSQAPFFEGYKNASAYVDRYSRAHPETTHYIRHGAPMGVAAYAVIMLEALDQWYRLIYAKEPGEKLLPVSSADFDAFIRFVAERPEFSALRFWVPGGSAGLGSGLSQVKRIRPDVEVFLTQVPGVDHVFNSLKAGHLIPKDQAAFDPDALRYVDGIAATAEPTTFEIVRGMADAVMRVPHQDNNAMARLLLSLGIRYRRPGEALRFLESELSPFLPLTNAVYARHFRNSLPSIMESGKHILIPVTGRTMDAALEEEISDLSFHDAYSRLLQISGLAPLERSELRSLDTEDRQELNRLADKVTERKIEEAVRGISDYRAAVEVREASGEKTLILQTLRFYEARIAADDARFEEARTIFDGLAAENPSFRDPSNSRTVPGQREVMNVFEKYKGRLESEGYTFVKKLGTGTFGDGYLFTHSETGRKVVLKSIGGLSLDMTEDVERMSASGQLAVEIDVNDRFFSAVGDDPARAVIPRNIEVFEEENAFGISMPEALVMNFVEGKPAADFLRDASADDIRIFREQLEEKWIHLLEALKAGGYLMIDYRPDNFFFRIESGKLVVETIDRGIMMPYPEEGSEEGRRELSAVGAIAMWKAFYGEPASLELRNRIRAVFELENEVEAYMKTSVRTEDHGRIPEFSDLLSALGLEFRGTDGKVGYAPSFQPPEPLFNLVLIPHGVTDANKRNVFHGHADSRDENLINEEGRAQALAGAPALAELIRAQGWKADELVILRSPLRRTGQTAEISLAELRTQFPGLPAEAVVDPDVIELSFGEWDGKDLSEIESLFGEDERRNAEKYRDLNALMRAASGENFLMVLARVRKVLESWNEKYKGKTVIVYGHGTFSAAVRVLMKNPQTQISDYITWRDSAVPARGMPEFIPMRSELRGTVPQALLESAREVGLYVTGGIYAVASAALLVPSAQAASEDGRLRRLEKLPEAEMAWTKELFSELVNRGGTAVLPAQALLALTPRARELFVESLVQSLDRSSERPVVYIAGEGAPEIKETFFTYPVFQASSSAQRLFEVRAQNESVIANRFNHQAVSVSLAGAASGEGLAGGIPAFLLRPDKIRELGEADQARLMVRMTLLQLLAAVELKDQPADTQDAAAAFLRKAGVDFSSSEGGFLAPSFQSLLSESVAARLAAYAATGKSA